MLTASVRRYALTLAIRVGFGQIDSLELSYWYVVRAPRGRPKLIGAGAVEEVGVCVSELADGHGTSSGELLNVVVGA
jgi:hypothetical protein